MRRALNLSLCLYWTAVFGLLAGFAVAHADRGVPAVLAALGAAPADVAAIAPGFAATAAFAALLTLAALLFVWAFVTGCAAGTKGAESADLLRLALAGGAFALTVTTVTAMLCGAGRVCVTLALHMVGMLATCLAVRSDAADERVAAAGTAQAMALHAARQYGLNRPGAGMAAADGGR